MLRQKNQQSVYDQIGMRSALLLMDLHKFESVYFEQLRN